MVDTLSMSAMVATLTSYNRYCPLALHPKWMILPVSSMDAVIAGRSSY